MRVLHTIWIISIIFLRSTFIKAKQKQLEWKCLISFFGKWNATESRQRHGSPRGTKRNRRAELGLQLQSCHQHFEIQWTLLWPKFRCQVLRLCVVCCVNGKYFSFSFSSSPSIVFPTFERCLQLSAKGVSWVGVTYFAVFYWNISTCHGMEYP